MPTTRSASKPSTNNDSGVKPCDTKNSKKRSQATEPDAKATKQAKLVARESSSEKKKLKLEKNPDSKETSTNSTTASKIRENPILINRSPVLQLWAAVVAQFLHPDLSWKACLSIGNSVSSLCAVAKGKAIGVIEPKDKTENEDGKDSKNKWSKDGTRSLEVMGFPMELRDDAVLVKGSSKILNEETLKRKYDMGDSNNEDTESNYDRVKKVMEDSLQSWKTDQDEFEKKAFHMYEEFRPNVARGQSGWGRKGELDLGKVARTIQE